MCPNPISISEISLVFAAFLARNVGSVYLSVDRAPNARPIGAQFLVNSRAET